MNHIKNCCALLLALCILLSLLAGCSSTGETSAASASTAGTASAAQEAAAPEPIVKEPTSQTDPGPAASGEAPASKSSETVIVPGEKAVAALDAGEIDRSCDLPLSAEGDILSYWCPTNFGASSGINSYNDHYGLRLAQEQTGVTLDISECNMTVAAEQFSLMVASDSLCDITVGFESYYTSGADNALDEDLIIDLADYLDSAPIYKQLLKADPDWYESLKTDDGHLPSFYTLYTDYAWIRESVAVRGDWLEELGLNLPMTYDDYFEVLSAFKSSYDPSYCLNIGSTLGSSWFESGYGISVSASGSSTSGDFYVEDGTVYSGYTSERFRDYLTMLHEWYEAGLVSSDYVTIGNLEFFENDYAALISSGEFGCVNGAGGLLESYAAYSDDPNFSFVPSYSPRLTDDSTLCCLTESTLTNSDYGPSISAKCENPELAMAFLDYFYTEDGEMLSVYGVEGESWEYDENGRPQLTELITSAGDFSGALMAYKTSLPTISNPQDSFRIMTSDSACEIMQFWTDDQNELMSHGGNAKYPSDATLTAKEAEEAANLLADIATYVSEAVPGFIMGTKSLEEFDVYCADLEGMDLKTVVAIYQAAYDRYIG